MTGTTKIRGEGGEISLEILGRENAQAQNVDDRNWLRANLSIKAGPFTGSVEIGLTSSELAILRDQLEAALESLNTSVDFENLESDWTFKIVFGTTGEALITGTITDRARANTLAYQFVSDPISLEVLARDIGRICEVYSAAQSKSMAQHEA